MTRLSTIAILGIISLLVFSTWAQADTPTSVQLSAQLFEDGDGFSYEGEVRVELSIEAGDGSVLWSESFANVALIEGWFDLELGSTGTEDPGPLADVLLTQGGEDLIFEVTLVDVNYTLPGNLKITAVPYALVATNAETLQGMDAEAFAFDGHAHEWSEIENKPQNFTPVTHNHPWGQVTGKPLGFDDGVDNDTTYSALEFMGLEFDGAGIGLLSDCNNGEILKWDGSGWTCDLDLFGEEGTTYTAKPNMGIVFDGTLIGLIPCTEGQILKYDETEGKWACSEDFDTTYSGADFALSGQACPGNQVLTGIDSSGMPICAADMNSGGDITGVAAGLGLSGGGTGGDVTLDVDFAGSGSAESSARSDHEHDGAYVNEGQTDSVSGTMLQDGSVGLDHLADMACGNGEILKWNLPGVQWACAPDDGLLPSTIFDGDLAGTYGNLQIRAGAVGSAEIADAGIALGDIGQNGCTNTQVLKWNGAAWACASDNGETYTPGTGINISGGVISNTGDTNAADDLISSTIFDGDLAGTYGNLQLRSGSVGSSEIADASIAFGDMGQNSCGADEVMKWDGAAWVCAPDQNSIYTQGAGISISGGVISNTGDTDASNDLVASTIFDGDLAGTYGNLQIRAGAVGSNEIGTDAVGSDEITDASIAFADIGQNSCINTQIMKWNGSAWACAADNGATYTPGTGISISAGVIANTGDTNASDDLTTSTTFSGDISGNYNSLQIGSGAVGSTEIANGTIALADIGQNSCGTNDVMKWGGSAWTCASDADTTYTGADFALSNQACPMGQAVTGIGSTGTPTCSSSVAFLNANGTISGNWVNTDNPWADNEVADNLTVNGGQIDDTVLGGTTPAAASVSTLDVTGTQITLDSDNASAGQSVSLIANQGANEDGAIRYNASKQAWEVSNPSHTAPVYPAVYGTVANYVQTVIVRPVGTMTENGYALQTAIKAIKDAGDASAIKPYLVKIEPGVYDLGSSNSAPGLEMLSYVDIEGSGQDRTVLFDHAATATYANEATVRAASNSQLRFLTIRKEATGGRVSGFYCANEQDVSLLHVDIIIPGSDLAFGTSASTNSRGIHSDSTCELTLDHVKITVGPAASGSSSNYGIYFENGGGGANLSADNLNIYVSIGQTSNYGIYTSSTNVDLHNLVMYVNASSGTSTNNGVFAGGTTASTLTIRDSEIEVDYCGSTSPCRAVFTRDGVISRLMNTRIDATNANSQGVYVQGTLSETIHIDNCVIKGGSYGVYVGANIKAYVGTTMMSGASEPIYEPTGPAPVVYCAGCYNGGYQNLNGFTACP